MTDSPLPYPTVMFINLHTSSRLSDQPFNADDLDQQVCATVWQCTCFTCVLCRDATQYAIGNMKGIPARHQGQALCDSFFM